MNQKSVENAKLAVNIGKTARLLDAGYSITEIAQAFSKPESTVRKWAEIIYEARRTKA